MSSKCWLAIGFLVLAALGCREVNTYYCQAHPDDPHCVREPDKCGDVMCAAPTPVCKTDTMACVECAVNTDCPVVRPICSEQDNCVVCEQHSDCPSELCINGDSCAPPEEVSYVGGVNASQNLLCSQDMPCLTLNQALAVAPPRRYVKAAGMVVESSAVIFDRRIVTIFGEPGSIITHGMNGILLDIRGESQVELVDLVIVGSASGVAVKVGGLPRPVVSMNRVKVRAPNGDGVYISDGNATITDSEILNSSGAGVNLSRGSVIIDGSRVADNTQEGVRAASGTSFAIRRSFIVGNQGAVGVSATSVNMATIESSIIAGNTGGGASIGGPFVIRNSIVSQNGSPAATIGGLTLNSANAVFEFNTVSDNVSSAPSIGVSCLVPMDVANSILTGNTISGCNVTYSLTSTALPGAGNKTGDPMFLSTNPTGATGPLFYRIGATSAARDGADPAATLGVDIDGDLRSDARRDMGADEVN